jgi:hypothetical protein
MSPRKETTYTKSSFDHMHYRCSDKKSPSYPRYGGRGIQVCERWSSLENFIADMGLRPQGAQIDRIDNERGYEPGNCRWASASEQARNKRNNKLTELDVRWMRICWTTGLFRQRDLAMVFGVDRSTVGRVVRCVDWA